MSRSAADATRFTATGPYASSKPGSSRLPYNLPGFMQKKQQNQQGGQGEAGTGAAAAGRKETPRQKVERLRAEARAARMAHSSLSGIDRMIEVGRRVANRAHKSMVYMLIATSGVCGVLTVYSMVSLAMYNKRQKAAWLDRELEKLQNARLAYANNTATPEQLELLRNEQIGEFIKAKKQAEKEQRPWNKAKRYLFGGMKMDEVVPEQTQTLAPAPEVTEAKPSVLEAVSAKTDDGMLTAAQPGQLDVLADNAESAIKQSSRSWFGWLTGR